MIIWFVEVLERGKNEGENWYKDEYCKAFKVEMGP